MKRAGRIALVMDCEGQERAAGANETPYGERTGKYLWIVTLTMCVACSWSAVATAGVILTAGDIVAVQQSSGRVYAIDHDSGLTTVVNNTLYGGASHVVVDSRGRILTASRGAAGVVRIDPETGLSESVAVGGLLQQANCLAFEDDSTLIVGDRESGIVRVDLGSGTQELLTSYDDVQDIAIGADGTMFLLDYGQYNSGGGRVLVLDPDTGSMSTLAQGGYLFNPVDMVLDANGDLLVSNGLEYGASTQILRIDAETGSQDMLFTLRRSGFIALEDPDTLLYADFSENEILRAELSSGHTELVSSDFYYVGNLTGIAVFVPEPATFTLLALGGLAVARRRKRA